MKLLNIYICILYKYVHTCIYRQKWPLRGLHSPVCLISTIITVIPIEYIYTEYKMPSFFQIFIQIFQIQRKFSYFYYDREHNPTENV